MSVQSSPRTDEKPARTSGAPISRTYLDAARSPMRIFFGVIFIAYSAISTVVGVRSDLSPLAWSTAALMGPLTIGAAIGIGLAVAIFIGEVLLAESSLVWFLPILAVDAWYTARWSAWIGDLIHAHMSASPLTKDALAILVTWGAAIAVAYFGEHLIFGKRRRRHRE